MTRVPYLSAEILRTALERPLPGPASLASRQLRRLASLWLWSRGVPLSDEGDVTNRRGAVGIVTAVSCCPSRLRIEHARVYVPRIHLARPPETLIAGFACRAAIDKLQDRVSQVSELWFAGYMAVSDVRRTRAHAQSMTTGVVPIPIHFFEENDEYRV